MLDFEPEPVAALKARYPKAVRKVFNPRYIQAHPEDAPTKDRTHVFDFPDGLRLGVSVDQADGERRTHYSASMYPTNPYRDIVEYTKFVVDHINMLRPHEMTGTLMTMLGPGGILHCLYDERHKGLPAVVQGNPKWN